MGRRDTVEGVRPHVRSLANTRAWLSGVIVLLGLAVAIVVLSSSWTPRNYPLNIGAGLATDLTPESAEAVALEAIKGMQVRLGREIAEPGIISIDAVKGSDVPDVVDGPALHDESVVWIVKATGTFVSFSSRYGTEPMSAGDGYFLLDDDGSIVGVGFPLP